ncbi:MAG: MFS transporter [Bdellovibrionales bacterium]|nr:MFS transporter [Bdellovibrionales bacterium]
MNFRFIISGLLLLICGSYLDNSRGVLLPVITEQFHLSYTQSSWFFIAGNIGAIMTLFLLLPLTHRFSEKKIALVTMILGILGLFFGFRVHGFFTLIPFSIFLGSALAVYGALSNLLIVRGSDLQSRSKIMCGLHMVYGMTSIVAPLVSGYFLSKGMSWSECLALVSVLLVGVLIFSAIKIPDEPHLEETNTSSLGLNGLQKWVVFVFCLYIAGEVLVSMWLVTFLVEAKTLSLSLSAKYLSLFFVVMTLTRGLCFLSFKEEQENRLLFLCLMGALFFFGLGYCGYLWAFPLVGVLGPFFPLFLARVSRVFHLQSKSVILWILAMGQVTLAGAHLLVGNLAGWMGIHRAFTLAGGLLFLSILGYLAYLPKERKYLRGLHPGT